LLRWAAVLAILALLGGLIGLRVLSGGGDRTGEPIARATASEGGQSSAWPSTLGSAPASALETPADTSAPTSTATSTAGATPSSRSTYRPTTGPTRTPAPATPSTQTPAATSTPAQTASAPCSVFPSSNVWNKRVDGLPVDSDSAAMVAAIGIDDYLHPDFDAIGDGIPYNIVTSGTPRYAVSFYYGDESDPGPYPIPNSPKIEKGSDHHLLAIDASECRLWEIYDASKSGSSWSGGSGATWDLHSNALRPAGWTSADAAGLPIFPGLVRHEEVDTGSIKHALRFTAPDTCGYIYPARHLTAPDCSNLPPMGLRVRLKADVDISGFGSDAQVVLTAMKRYGMILADNGSPWYVSGVPSIKWDDHEFHLFHTLHGSDFEVVDTSGLRNG
jgi:hypothetical protein